MNMKVLEGLKFIFLSRGPGKILARLSTINKRFGFTAAKQIKYINYYISLLRGNGVKATFFIPAKIFERYSKDLKKINSDSIEWGIHGCVHNDLSVLDKEAQEEELKKAIEIFDRCGIDFIGFRAPYLRTNSYTLEAISKSGRFLYASTDTILWDEAYNGKQAYYKWIKDFYHPDLHSDISSLPRIEAGIMTLPVLLPDDDVLVDRERFGKSEVSTLWGRILEECHKKNEVFVLQLHPERIYELDTVLVDLIKKAKMFTPPLWITSLNEIARWEKINEKGGNSWPDGHQGAFCITGDIDAITISDFIIRLREWR